MWQIKTNPPPSLACLPRCIYLWSQLESSGTRGWMEFVEMKAGTQGGGRMGRESSGGRNVMGITKAQLDLLGCTQSWEVRAGTLTAKASSVFDVSDIADKCPYSFGHWYICETSKKATFWRVYLCGTSARPAAWFGLYIIQWKPTWVFPMVKIIQTCYFKTSHITVKVKATFTLSEESVLIVLVIIWFLSTSVALFHNFIYIWNNIFLY